MAVGPTPFLAVLLVPAAYGVLRSPTLDPVRAKHRMVVSAEVHASRAGVEVMENSGNAVNAVVATGFASAVTSPVAGNVGEGGFMEIWFLKWLPDVPSSSASP